MMFTFGPPRTADRPQGLASAPANIAFRNNGGKESARAVEARLLKEFLDRVSVSARITNTDHMDRMLKGDMHAAYDRAMAALAKSRPFFVESVGESGGSVRPGWSEHFSKNKKMFYTTRVRRVTFGWSRKSVELLEFDCNARWDDHLNFLRDSSAQREGLGSPEQETGLSSRRKNERIFMGLKEYHIPDYEFTEDGQTRRKNPCELRCHSDMLMDYKNTVLHFNEKGIPSSEIGITEHVGYRKRDGVYANRLDAETGEADALINQLIYNMYLGKLDALLRSTPGMIEYRHGFEIMPEDNASSENMSKPFHLIVTMSAYGGIVIDLAHLLQNRQLKQFHYVNGRQFELFISSLRARLRERKQEIEGHLQRTNAVLSETGFERSGIHWQDIDRHLGKLTRLGYAGKAEWNGKNEALGGEATCLDTLFFWIEKAKKLTKRPERPLLSVVHVVLPESKQIKELKTKEEVLDVLRRDRCWKPGEDAEADRFMLAIMRKVVEILRKYPDARISLVNEATQKNNRIDLALSESLELYADAWEIYRRAA